MIESLAVAMSGRTQFGCANSSSRSKSDGPANATPAAAAVRDRNLLRVTLLDIRTSSVPGAEKRMSLGTDALLPLDDERDRGDADRRLDMRRLPLQSRLRPEMDRQRRAVAERLRHGRVGAEREGLRLVEGIQRDLADALFADEDRGDEAGSLRGRDAFDLQDDLAGPPEPALRLRHVEHDRHRLRADAEGSRMPRHDIVICAHGRCLEEE